MLATGVQWLVEKVATIERGVKLNLYRWKLKIMIPDGYLVAYIDLISFSCLCLKQLVPLAVFASPLEKLRTNNSSHLCP